MSDYRWDTFVQRITIQAEVSTIYKAWATQKGLEKWFLRSAVFVNSEGVKRAKAAYIHSPDTYEWLWHGYGDDVLEKGKILEANGVNGVKFTFSGDCQVQVKIYAEGGMNICELTQSYIPLDEKSKIEYHIGCMNGWNFYLTNLKSILEGGIDLRNKNEKIRRVVNA